MWIYHDGHSLKNNLIVNTTDFQHVQSLESFLRLSMELRKADSQTNKLSP